MYSNVDQASALNATYGLSESMVDPVPSRYTPPSLTAVPPLDELPHAAATSATTAAATATGHGTDADGSVAGHGGESCTLTFASLHPAAAGRQIPGWAADQPRHPGP